MATVETTAKETAAANELADDVVVTRVLAGELRLFEVLMRRYNRRAFRAARSIVRSDAEAEDVMQEAYVRAYSHLEDLQQRARFGTWLTRIAVREAIAHARKRGEHASVHELPEEEEPMTNVPSPERAVSDVEMARVLEEAIDALPVAFRTVFVLRAVEGMSAVEVAQTLEIPEETVRTRFHRARERLRNVLLTWVDTAATSAFDFHLRRCDRVVSNVFQRLGID